MLFTTWWSEEAAFVMDMPAGVCLWTEDGGTFIPRLTWYEQLLSVQTLMEKLSILKQQTENIKIKVN